MSSFGYFCYLAAGTAEFLAYLAPVTLPLSLLASCGIIWGLSRRSVSRGRVLVACVAPAIVPAGLLTVGVAFVRPEATAWPEGVPPPVPWFTGVTEGLPRAAITVLAWLNVPLGLGLGWWTRRGWPGALAAALWWGWVSMCAAGMATMSVTGTWL
jgi:hypothetical protein